MRVFLFYIFYYVNVTYFNSWVAKLYKYTIYLSNENNRNNNENDDKNINGNCNDNDSDNNNR